MLALPSRRGQCLFCCVRTSLARHPDTKYVLQRTSISTTPLGRLHRGSRRIANPGSLKSDIGTRQGRPNRSKDQADELSEADLQNRTYASLRRLKKYLQKPIAGSDSDLTRLAALDPHGTQWKNYADRVDRLISSSEGSNNRQDSRLIGSIGAALREPHWNSAVQRALHFGFIDHVIENRRDLAKFGATTADLRYPTEWYGAARQTQRDIHLHVGPTNSGKTYNALKRLEESGSGFYAGPLRLLAHEVYTRFKAKGIPCDLVTGDDVRLDDNVDVSLAASTVEMVNVSRPVEVAVIDEIQMIASEDRGWAWSRAFLGAHAKEVHLCGETRVVPLVQELTASMGDTLHIHEYKRLNPLRVMTHSLKGDLKNLKKGDCLVAFSVLNIHALKKQIELETGRRCAIVYGSLPPETRAQQAALFNDPNNDYDYLVASDAIGMGLNLSVKRIIFHTTTKFNGVGQERLSIPQVKQIGGRAGRYRTANQATNHSSKTKQTPSVGLVTTLHEEDLPYVQRAMSEEAPPIRAAGILPPGDYLEALSMRLPKGVPFEYIMRRVSKSPEMHRRYAVCDIRDQCRLSRLIEDVPDLTVAQRLILTAAPATSNSGQLDIVFKALARAISENREVTVVDIPEIKVETLEKPLSGDRVYLESLEDLHKSLILFLWLSYRFISVFKDRDMAIYTKELTEEKINTCLLEFSANPALRKRVLTQRKLALPPGFTEMDLERSSLPGISLPELALPVDWTRGQSDVPDHELSVEDSATESVEARV